MKVYAIEYHIDWEGFQIEAMYKNKDQAIKALSEKIGGASRYEDHYTKVNDSHYKGDGEDYLITEYEVL